jgi:hypothetical protein
MTMTGTKEILIYGLPAGETRDYMETILYSRATTIQEAEKVAAILERDHGCTRIRIWSWNGAAPSFGKNVLA